jgi:FkbM family methyltransferase
VAEEKTLSVELEIGTWSGALGMLMQKGLRLGSFIDIGSADGYFGLAFWRAGLFRDVTVVNIDANPVYEPTLRKIHSAIGGDYRICAVDERPGTLELHASAHPYWSSAVPPDDPYWETINGQVGETTKVACRTLDSIVDELRLPTPYAIKLDVQGLEARVLRSGQRTLKDTAAVITEVFAHNFREVNSALEAAGFQLHDISDIKRAADHSLGWFYTTYLHPDYLSLRSNSHWDSEANDAILEQQVQRRDRVLGKIDRLLAKINAEKKRG